MTPKLKVTDLYKSFGSHKVLHGMSFSVNQGQSLVILGGSGSGKSVALKCLLGILKPDKGSIELDGQNLALLSTSEQEKLRGEIGMLFQGGALFDSLPIWHNISFSLLSNKKINRQQARELAIKKLKEVGLSEAQAIKYPAELSGGMQKRVGLARAIAAHPSLIFFDEPTTGLDPIMCHIIDSLIVDCVKRLGASAIIITHDLRSVRRIADKVALLYQGRIIWTGDVKEMDETDNPYVRQFVNGSIKGPMKY